MAQKELPCYLFVGMLASGKTKFIQETMEDPQFDSGDKTLLLSLIHIYWRQMPEWRRSPSTSRQRWPSPASSCQNWHQVSKDRVYLYLE